MSESIQSKYYQLLFDFIGIQVEIDSEMEKEVALKEQELGVKFPPVLREMYVFVEESKYNQNDNMGYQSLHDEEPRSIICRKFENLNSNWSLRLEELQLWEENKLWFFHDNLLGKDVFLELDNSDDPPVFCSKSGKEYFKLYDKLSDFIYMTYFEIARMEPYFSRKHFQKEIQHYKGISLANIEHLSEKYTKNIVFDSMDLKTSAMFGGYENGPIHEFLFLTKNQYLLIRKEKSYGTILHTWFIVAKEREPFEQMLEQIWTEFPFLKNQVRLMSTTRRQFIKLHSLSAALKDIKSPEWELRWGAINTMKICSGEYEEKLTHLFVLLEDEFWRVRLNALEYINELVKIHRIKSLKQKRKMKYLEMLVDPEKKVRVHIFLHFEFLTDEDILEVFRILKRKPKDEIILDILIKLKHLEKRPEKIKRELVDTASLFLEDESIEIKLNSLNVLRKYSNYLSHEIIGKIKKLCNDDNKTIQRIANSIVTE